MRLYNSLTRQKEEFTTLLPNEVKMYACGITVSGDAHIGHGLQAIIFDILRKYLIRLGYKVIYARNYTDVDDKIIAAAISAGIPANVYAENKIADIEKDMARLGVSAPTMTLLATENIQNIINFVQKLIDKGYAYATPEGDVYFDVQKDKNYGKLSNRKLEDAMSGSRIEYEDNKRSHLDFALWKSAKPNEIKWQSPFGEGRPGWHIECSAMNLHHLGEQIDIHGGGRDLIFPHHENEIAQTECLTEKQFAQFWVHNGLIKINGQKMSKSLGNSITLKDILDEYNHEIIRLSLLQTKYRADINITDNLFPDSKAHLLEFYKILKEIEDKNIINDSLNTQIEQSFDAAMSDDLNTALAISNLFAIFKNMQAKLDSGDDSVKTDYNSVKSCYNVLGLFTQNADQFLLENTKIIKIPNEIIEIAEKRKAARENRDYATSDILRDEIKSLGYSVEDKPKNEYVITKI